MTTAVQTKGVFTGRKMLWSMIAFFGVIIAVNITLTVFALQTRTGLVVRNSYVASQDFNRMQAAAAAQEKLGWQMTIQSDGEGVRIDMRDRAGVALPAMNLQGVVGRPVSDRMDSTLAFTQIGPGSYFADARLAAGDWQVDVTATDAGGRTFRRIFRIDGGARR